ncbi:DUF1450 domain-containing protein [Paenactinomyces guangxiensis]|uniref:DUF1450 domain-containing protein n=1 Tax=Paenactinomyces guangxiensis TaxID=1490290 RepID=A0A7W2A6S4_9BACL|nr:DUF1450 domain-containing protein [Paenactinomyces guangxiensis]MBH8591014.1 DUF1450 domain-containing protein [Paenactinomyces guangxiensis]
MKKITVEFCISNLVKGSLSAYYCLKNQNHSCVKIKMRYCLGLCSCCEHTLYAYVNDQLIEADTPDKLYEKIIHYLSFYSR